MHTLATNDGNAHISIPLGIFIGLLASFIQSLGLTVQRKSHVLNARLPESHQRVEHRRPLWLLGFAIFISSNIIGSLVQIASLPVVILAPLGAVSLLWNAFFACFILGDVFSPWMILGTFFIAGGAVLIAIFGIVPEPTRSLEDLLELFRRPAFVAYFSLLGAAVVVCLAITHIAEFSLARKLAAFSTESITPPTPTLQPTNPSALITGVTEEIAATEETPLLLLDRKIVSASLTSSPDSMKQSLESPPIRRTRLLIAISFASFSGIISGMCLLFAKSGVELLLLTVTGHNQFWRWQSWMLLIALAIFALLQLWYLHKALVLADPTLVCPSAFCFYNLSSIVNGLVYFDQFSLISPLHLGLVVIGIVVLLAGVWVVSIQAGGGGIDVDRWQEGDEPLTDNVTYISEEPETDGRDIEEGVHEADQSQPLLIGRRSESRPLGPVPMERQTVSDSQIHGPPGRQSLRIETPTLDGAPTLSLPDATSSPESSPTRRRRGETAPDSLLLSPSSTTRPRRRRRQTIQPTDSPHSYSPPLGSGSVLGAGLSIGLGPMSPGFSIVPLDRRRRISGHGFADVVEQERGQRRRTVSEGDLRRSGEETNGPGEGAVDSGGRGDETGGGAPVEETPGKNLKAKMRWRWVRRIFMDQR